jgi:hypothetical protein
MSAELSVHVITRAVEQVPAELVLIALFEDRSPPAGIAGRVDWRLGGELSAMLASGRFAARPGEALMIAGARGLRAARIVGLGAGQRADFDDERAREWVEAAVACALDLRVRGAALELPEVAGSLRLRVEIALAGAARVIQPRGAALALDLLVSPLLERSVHEALRSARPRGLQRPLPIRLPQAPGPDAAASPAPRRAPAAVPAVK